MSADRIGRVVCQIGQDAPVDEFFIEDQGDGWWHCPSPLRCVIVAGPARLKTGFSGEYLLASTDPPIEWHGDSAYSDRWGSESALCRPVQLSGLVLVLASHESFRLKGTDWSIPAIPLTNWAESVEDAEFEPELAVKVGVRGFSPERM
jgi:hypothetical protein